MKKIIFASLLIFCLQAIKSQESYFKVEHFGIYSPNKTVTLSFPNLKKEQIEAKIIGFIKEKNMSISLFCLAITELFLEIFHWCAKKKNAKQTL